ncbi:hypothetical protein C8P66_102204 [Humitalea rosea]|uniref:Uncharacterized protein n=1 Tax=Humitalea rosea TaxID=990373 RepID=A0A2W7ISC0_9PROT|nr:hypothetical protein [Humitalea rosea]PZW50516.1 hypothetical protein C8P66_102204 [Humitalea rosea]
MDLQTLTTVHTLISLVALVAGAVVVAGLIAAHPRPGWTVFFLITAIATSTTGFLFPFNGVLPSHVVGVLALLVLVLVLAARYVFAFGGPWRLVDALGLVASEYLLVFVGVAQAFAKTPFLHAAAPTQSEPPFAVAQLVALLGFAVLAYLVARAARRGGGVLA